MENRADHKLCFLNLVCIVVVVLSSSLGGVEGYKNYTVGDTLGWYDSLENPKIDYRKWVSGKNFSLGDFLIFNTDNNHSVIQTYNFTTYTLCNYDDSVENDTTQWSSSNPSSTTPVPITVAVPLTKVGATYFFSSDYDGDQCKNGQHFGINVTHGQGLPPSMASPSAYSPAASPESGDDGSGTFTLGPARDEPSDNVQDESSNAVSLVEFYRSFGVRLCTGVLLLAGHFLVY